MNRRGLKIVDAIVVPPLRLLGFVFGGIYKLLFSGLDRRLALKHQQQLEQDIWKFVPFLFARDGARIISKEIGRIPPFDYADVDVISPPLKFHFVRGRGDLDVYVTRNLAESVGHELSLVLSTLDLRPEVRRGSISLSPMLIDCCVNTGNSWYKPFPMRNILSYGRNSTTLMLAIVS